ncbi:hypothetical protein [Ellagibacter isourolithinifaciens]|uniref:hypothetical protein n=1 Tax=Ellagibacter isourolithinifaciens TaxID=2137581 RepID=UPI003A90B2F5
MAGVNTYVKGLKTVAQIIGAATTVVGAAGTLKDSVQPVLDSDEGKVAVGKAKGAIVGIADKAISAKGSFLDARKAKKEERDFAKALKEAQQTVLVNASRSIPMKDYLKLRGNSETAAAVISAGLFDSPGCFAIATYAKFDFDSDLTDYTGVYVGAGPNVGDAIDLACSRAGSPDVYADVKYEQNVHLYVYPCAADELDTKKSALVDLLQAEQSYNAPINEG